MVDSFASEVMKIRSRPYLGLYIWNVQTSIAFVRLDEYITFLVILSYSNIVLTKKSGFVFGRDLQALMAVRYPQCSLISLLGQSFSLDFYFLCYRKTGNNGDTWLYVASWHEPTLRKDRKLAYSSKIRSRPSDSQCSRSPRFIGRNSRQHFSGQGFRNVIVLYPQTSSDFFSKIPIAIPGKNSRSAEFVYVRWDKSRQVSP